MNEKFHVNQHGVPVPCNSPISSCVFCREVHFETYGEAERYVGRVDLEFKSKLPLSDESIKKIKSYYNSLTAINEFPSNKVAAEIDDFDLVIISWLGSDRVEREMLNNTICGVKFTYGDIVRVLNEEVKTKYHEELKLNKYYNPIPYDYWDDEMKSQMNIYKNTMSLSMELKFDYMEVVSLPMSARKCLQKDGYISNHKNIHEVIYKVQPQVSKFGNVVAYNHSTEELGKEFSIYELAGAVEGKTLHDLCYSNKLEDQFHEMWKSSKFANNGEIDYESAVNRYRDEQLYRGIEGTDIPKAFMKSSPVVARCLSRYIKNYRAIMLAISEILIRDGLTEDYEYESEDDGDWGIEL